MRYFVSYASVYQNDDTLKRARLRLQTYNMSCRFLNKKIPNNVISKEFLEFREYLMSKEFTKIYFLSPYILNENQIAKDMMKLLTSSGETNYFNLCLETIKDEIKTIKLKGNYKNINVTEVSSVDEYIEKYLSSPNELYKLKDNDDYKDLIIFLKSNFNKDNDLLSNLYLKLLINDSKSKEDILNIISLAKPLLEKKNDETLLICGSAYENQNYTSKDKYIKSYNCYLKASEHNNPDGLYLVGLFNMLGLIGEKDLNKAYEYFSKAAAFNQTDAISCLGIYYLSKGDKKNARFWLDKSAKRGDYKALLLLDSDFDRK